MIVAPNNSIFTRPTTLCSGARSPPQNIETIIVYKLPEKSREEIAAMFSLGDLKQTRFYQDAFADGEQLGERRGRQIGEQRGEQKSQARSNPAIAEVRIEFRSNW